MLVNSSHEEGGEPGVCLEGRAAGSNLVAPVNSFCPGHFETAEQKFGKPTTQER